MTIEISFFLFNLPSICSRLRHVNPTDIPLKHGTHIYESYNLNATHLQRQGYMKDLESAGETEDTTQCGFMSCQAQIGKQNKSSEYSVLY